MSESKRLTGTVYTSLDNFRAREGGHEQTFQVTDDEAADLLLSIEPVPDAPPDGPMTVDERFAAVLASYEALLARMGDDPEWRSVLERERDHVRRARAEARGEPPEAA